MSITIRTLTVGDRKRVTQIFKKAILELKDESIKNIIRSDAPVTENSQTDEEQMGEALINVAVSFLTKAIDIVDVDVSEWFADLVGKTPEEFESLPMNTELDVIDAIRTAPEAADFFTRCFAVAKTTAGLEGLLGKARERFSSIFDAERAKVSTN